MTRYYFHDDLKGYSWNVPKSQWLNIGTGASVAREVGSAWRKAHDFFEKQGTIPLSSLPALDKMKGHSYTSLNNKRLAFCQGDHVFLVGDSLGLAQPLTGEGILPAVLSGKLCATAIAEGAPETYRKRLRTNPIISDYQIFHSGKMIITKLLKNSGEKSRRSSGLFSRLIVTVFVALFSGKSIPGSRLWAKMRAMK